MRRTFEKVNSRSSTDHKGELLARAQQFLDELRTAAAAARERVFAGVARAPDLMPAQVLSDLPARFDTDPIFATREFDLPAEVTNRIQ